MKKTVAIFSKNLRTSLAFFEELIGNMLYRDIVRISKNPGRCYVETVDETIYKVVPANVAVRGSRFTDAYILEGVEQAFIDGVIMPSLVPHDDGSEPTITYF